MKNPTKEHLVDLMLSMGHVKFTEAFKEICQDNIKSIHENYPQAWHSLAVWEEISQYCDRIKALFLQN